MSTYLSASNCIAFCSEWFDWNSQNVINRVQEGEIDVMHKETIILFLAPSILGVGTFVLLPSLDVVQRSFFSATGDEFRGLDNYVSVLNNSAFQLAVKNSVMFLVVCIPLLLVLSFGIAYIINKTPRVGHVLRSVFLLPMAVPITSIVLIWNVVFNDAGYANAVLDHLGGYSVDWMGTDASFWVLIGAYIWKNLGYNIVLWSVGLAAIPFELYEAALVDGASSWQSFRHITLPAIMPTFYTVCVLAVLNSFRVFREAYLVAGSYPNESMYMLQHLFNNWFLSLSVDKLSAGAIMVFAVIALLMALLRQSWNRE